MNKIDRTERDKLYDFLFKLGFKETFKDNDRYYSFNNNNKINYTLDNKNNFLKSKRDYDSIKLEFYIDTKNNIMDVFIYLVKINESNINDIVDEIYGYEDVYEFLNEEFKFVLRKKKLKKLLNGRN